MKEFTIPTSLMNIPDPPKKLYIRGEFPKSEKYLCVVGSRKYSEYGRRACESLIEGLRRCSVTIVSGLALGIDTVAHRSALRSGLRTIAFPGSGLNDEVIVPPSHLKIAHEIIDRNGCLISEFEPSFPAQPWTFPQRNRLMAGISDAVLIVEAAEKSGTLITARMALDYNKTVFAVPGSIFSMSSKGSNLLLKWGATPVASADDIIDALGFDKQRNAKDFDSILEDLRSSCSVHELQIISNLTEPMSKNDLCARINISISEFNIALSLLELKDVVEEKFGKIYLKIF